MTDENVTPEEFAKRDERLQEFAKRDELFKEARLRELERISLRDLEPIEAPIYIGFLKVFGSLSAVVGSIAFLVLIKTVLSELNSPSYSANPVVWIVALALTIEGFLAFGLLYATADIAKNMIDVGGYVRHLSAVERKKLLEQSETNKEL